MIMSLPSQRVEAPHSGPIIGRVNGKDFYNISYAGVPRVELPHENDDYSEERAKAISCCTKGGVKPMSKEEQEYERSLNWELLKKFTTAIFNMDITRFSFPAGFCEKRTALERSSDLFAFLASGFLESAIVEKNPVRRISLVSIGIIASFHLYLQKKKPWNPVIGETYVAQWGNGVTIWAEQVSHHPPISCVQLRPEHSRWKIDAQLRFGVNPGVFVMEILQGGPTRLTFDDGTEYEWEFPAISLTGILTGDRVVKVKGPLNVKDVTNGLTCHVKVSPKKDKSRNLKYPRATTIWGGVRLKKSQYLSSITGDYTDKIYLDGELAWDISSFIASKPNKHVEDNDVLLSDSRYRIDRANMITGDLRTTDQAKALFEQLQREAYRKSLNG